MLLRAIICFTIVALLILLNGGLNLSDFGFLGLFFFFGFGVLGLYFLFILIKERLLGQPFMKISNNRLVVNRLFRKKVINFSDVKSFDHGTTFLGSTDIYIYYKQRMDSIKDSINFMFVNMNAHNLCNLLNRIKSMSGRSQSANNMQKNRLQKLFKDYRLDDQKPYSPVYSTRDTFLSLIAIIAAVYVLIHPDRIDFNVDITIFILFIIVTFFFLLKVMPSLIVKILLVTLVKTNSSRFSSCLFGILLPISTLGFIFTSTILYSEYKNSIKSCFYYHTSANGIRYDIPKIGRKKEAIIKGATEGTCTIDIPEFITYKDAKYPVTTIDEKAFKSCTSLTSVIIGDSVKHISANAFCYCSNLRYLKVKNGNPVYYSPDRCDAIIRKSSYRGKDYKDLIVGCENTVIPEDVTSIGGYAFSGRVNMTSVTIPSSVTNIDRSAFNFCIGLTSVVIPGRVTYIGEYAFYRCKNLTSVVIPESVWSIYNDAFYECNSLTDVYCYAKAPPFRNGKPSYL